jgi:hypothetical protein
MYEEAVPSLLSCTLTPSSVMDVVVGSPLIVDPRVRPLDTPGRLTT